MFTCTTYLPSLCSFEINITVQMKGNLHSIFTCVNGMLTYVRQDVYLYFFKLRVAYNRHFLTIRFIWDWPQIQIICGIRIFNCISHIKLSFITRKPFPLLFPRQRHKFFLIKCASKLLTTYRYMSVSYYSTVEVRTGVNNVCSSGVNPASVYLICHHSLYML